MRIRVKSGDITKEKSDALVVALNPNGMQYGGINDAIMNVAGYQYHRVVASALDDDPGADVVVAYKGQNHRGSFNKVIFVMDYFKLPLNQLVRLGLETASSHFIKKVSMPMMRFGTPGFGRETADDRVKEIVAAATAQSLDDTNNITELTIMVYNDNDLYDKVVGAFKTNQTPLSV